MAIKTFEVVFKLRRDNDYNYEKVKDSFIPKKEKSVQQILLDKVFA